MEVTKKVRMSRAEAKALARLAKRLKQSEGQVLRDGLAAIVRRQARRDGIEDLIRMAEGETYTKIAFELK